MKSAPFSYILAINHFLYPAFTRKTGHGCYYKFLLTGSGILRRDAIFLPRLDIESCNEVHSRSKFCHNSRCFRYFNRKVSSRYANVNIAKLLIVRSTCKRRQVSYAQYMIRLYSSYMCYFTDCRIWLNRRKKTR